MKKFIRIFLKKLRRILTSLLILVIINIFFLWFSGSKVLINFPNVNFTVKIGNLDKIECSQKKCEIALRTSIFGKNQKICVENENFLENCSDFFLSPRGKIIWSPQMTKKPKIISEENLPVVTKKTEEIEIPKSISNFPHLANSKEIFFFNPEISSIFQFYKSDDSKLISKFENLADFKKMEFLGKNILFSTARQIFLIDVQKKNKFQVFSGDEVNFKIISENLAIFEKNFSEHFVFTEENFQLKKIDIPDFSKVCAQNKKIFLAKCQKENCDFKQFFLNSGKEKNIFLVKITGDFLISCSENGQIEIWQENQKQIIEF